MGDKKAAFYHPSEIEQKRSRHWFVDSVEIDSLPNKKQATEDADGKSSSGLSNVFASWESYSSFHSAPVQFFGQSFRPESRPVNFGEKKTSVVADDLNARTKMIFGKDASFDLSISHPVQDSDTCLGFSGFGRVKVDGVKDRSLNLNTHCVGNLHQAYNREPEERSVSIGQDVTHVMPFGGFLDEQDVIPVNRPAGDYDRLYNQSSVELSIAAHKSEMDVSNSNAALNSPQMAKLKPESLLKNSPNAKVSRKEAANSFPSNVRNLISTGMLDGVPVKYISVTREELPGVIKGFGYLCGCRSCKYAKVLNAHEFETHAGCKTKHPNKHVYFENGKTIYQIVQELKSTPESLLVDTIQTVLGSHINQKAFHIWKESFQAATRELQRIYGKEVLNV